MGYKMKHGNKKNNTCQDSSPIKGLFGGLGKTLGKVLNPASMHFCSKYFAKSNSLKLESGVRNNPFPQSNLLTICEPGI